MSYNLKSYLQKFVYVVLSEGNVIEGKLIGFDNHLNITIEKQIIMKEQNDISSVEIIRGDNVVLIGELDIEKVLKVNEKVDKQELAKYYNKDYKVYRSTKNKIDKTTIKAWKLYNQLRPKNATSKRKMGGDDDSTGKRIKKSDIST